MSTPFVIVDGLITVEAILKPSWIVRKRLSDDHLMSPYGWVANMVETAPGECSVKGYLAKEDCTITKEDWVTLKRIGEKLNFNSGYYDRVDDSGKIRKTVRIWKG